MILQVKFTEASSVFDLLFSEQEQFSVDFGEIYEIVSSDVPVYEDSYTVRPALVEQTLETAGLLMRQDVTVEQIPIYVVSNNSGGTTVTIGG